MKASMKISINTLKKILLMMLLAPLFSGCAYQSIQPNPAFAPVRPQAQMDPPNDSGSLFQNSTNIAFFESNKARRVGDILTVIFDENHAAKKETKTDDNRSSSNTLLNPTVFGVAANAVTGAQPGLLKALNMNVSSTGTFKANGKSEQKDSLTGSITVSVVEVLANNNLVVRGEKLLTLNQGDEYVQLSGIIRSTDVGPDNKIVSSKIANARIVYSGQGTTHDSNKEGWLTRFLMSDKNPF